MPLPHGAQSVLVKPSSTNLYLKEALKILGASLFIALCSQICVPLFFTPVPFSFQTFAIAITGWMLGSKRGAIAVLAYLSEGLMGIPVFAHGSSGIASFAGPCGGYLVGFVAGAFVSGYLTKGSTNVVRLALGFVACSAAIHLFGLPWLATWTGPEQALQLGLYPFILGDLLKIGFSISCVKIWEANAKVT